MTETDPNVAAFFDDFDAPIFETEDHPPYSEVWRTEDLDRIVRERNRLKTEQEETTEIFKAEIDRIQQRYNTINKSYEQKIDILDRSLINYHLETGKKTVHYPSGTLTVKKKPASLIIEDQLLTLDWVRQHLPDAIKKTETFQKSVIKKAINPETEQIVTHNGELIDTNDNTPFHLSETEHIITIQGQK